ncbi:hypothetical protein GA0070624_6662 [Micromonospora rhizosphaerae]|uniref:Uncharacterized protein n=1 Tax=Micromonospora rhizosphaerae TaxID=568872 RepID=A0A1C6TDC9_9ACTN|nr:hypothetical protein [Micromonospora rhizosphaerae]SCL39709.1 hypothetical protein GA0070624_6662 [Micromonospora rhizosphaerae]
MSRELSRLYRVLAEDTDGQALMAPEQLRRRADRRARNRAAVGALAAVALLAGAAVGTQIVLAAGPDSRPGPPAGTPTPPSVPPTQNTPAAPSPTETGPTLSRTPGTSPSTGRPTAGTPTSIPDRAFFTLAAANDTGLPPQFRPGPVLPALCGAEPGESNIVQRRARVLAYRLASTPKGYVPDGSYRHSITIYRTGRADDALRELRQAVRNCPEQEVTGGVTFRLRLLDGGGYGDESVLFEMRTPYRDINGDPTGGDEVRLIRAVRIGDVVTVLWEQGWENTSSDRSQVDADSRRAVTAIRKWLM